ncbi:hypothetical protein ACOMHN_024497 [Nucella lapillus]
MKTSDSYDFYPVHFTGQYTDLQRQADLSLPVSTQTCRGKLTYLYRVVRTLSTKPSETGEQRQSDTMRTFPSAPRQVSVSA